MAFPTWPAAFGNPDAPVDDDANLPLATGEQEAIGAFKTDRIATRPVVKATATLTLTGALFDTFRAFWRDTLNRGTSFFDASWIATLGYVGYVGKITTYTMSTDGVMPKVNLELELHPHVRLVSGDVSPWPAP